MASKGTLESLSDNPIRTYARDDPSRKSHLRIGNPAAYFQQHCFPLRLIMTIDGIAKRLGGFKVLKASIRTEIELAAAVAEGLPTGSIDALVRGNVVLAHEVAALLLPSRTLADRKKKRRPLTPEESDRVARVARIHARAAEALGSEEKAFAWLRRANRALGGKAPVDLLRTGEGGRLADAELTRLEHGVFS